MTFRTESSSKKRATILTKHNMTPNFLIKLDFSPTFVCCFFHYEAKRLVCYQIQTCSLISPRIISTAACFLLVRIFKSLSLDYLIRKYLSPNNRQFKCLQMLAQLDYHLLSQSCSSSYRSLHPIMSEQIVFRDCLTLLWQLYTCLIK